MGRWLFLLAGLAGAILGVSGTLKLVRGTEPPFAQAHGPWRFAPRLGAPDIDPYQRAHLFARGELPLAAGEGFALVARTDGAGRPLDGACRYRIDGPAPAARYWTLALHREDGRPIVNAAGRQAFVSSEIVRFHAQPFRIVLAPAPAGANWLPTLPGDLVLTLRLYDTPLSAPATAIDPAALPSVTREGCAS